MAPEQLTPGSLVAERFVIERTAGRGGMGTVYKARDRDGGGVVALKLLHDDRGRFDEADRFAREATLLSELRHPGIVSHIAHGQTAEGQRFLAMEWLEGEELTSRLHRGPLTVGESVLLLRQVSAALACAHGRGILHRDLKPSEIAARRSRRCGSPVNGLRTAADGLVVACAPRARQGRPCNQS